MSLEFRAPTTNLALAAELASLVETLDQSNWRTAIFDSGQRVASSLTSYFGRDSTEDAPRCMRIALQEGDLILFQGVKQTGTAAKLVRAYGNPGSAPHERGVNTHIVRAVNEVWEPLYQSFGAFRPNVLLSGHSFGGACAQVMAASIKRIYPNVNVRAIVFGPPRPGNAVFRDTNRSLDCVRYWNYGDPIGRIPPHSDEAAFGHVMLGRDVSRHFNSYVHAGRSVMVDREGYTWEQSEPPINSTLNVERNLFGWATGLIERPVEDHSINQYARNLLAASLRNESWHRGPPGATVRARRDAPLPHPAALAEVPALVAEVAAVQAARLAERSLPIHGVFEAHNIEGEWAVYRGAEFVTFAANRTRARRLADQGNRMVRAGAARGINNSDAVAAILASLV